MKRIIAGILAMLLIFSMVPVFANVAEESGNKLKEKGIVKGGNNGDLMLDKVLTRVEMAVLLARLYAEEKQAKEYKQPSEYKDEKDVPKWGKNYVSYAKMRGWLKGDSVGNFSPNEAVTGEQLATILLRILGYQTAKWGKNRAELLAKTGIAIEVAGDINRGQVFEALWDAVSKPVMSDGVSVLLERIEQGKKDYTSGDAQKKAHIVWYPETVYDTLFFREGMQRVKLKENGIVSVGYMNEKGELVIKIEVGLHDVGPNRLGDDRFGDGRAIIVNGRGTGFIDKSGKTVIPEDYEDASYFSEGLAWVKNSEGWSYIDINGNVVIDGRTLGGKSDLSAGGIPVNQMPLIDYAFQDGLAYYGNGERYGFINKKGEVVIPISTAYHRLNRFSEGLALVVDERAEELKYGFIDKTGKIVIDINYVDAQDFSGGLAAVNMGTIENQKWGYIDQQGKLVIPAEYSQAGPFSEGLAVVGVSDGKGVIKYGYIDKTGKLVIRPTFDVALPFHEGFAVVSMGGFYGLIDKTGKIAVNYQYSFIRNVRDGLAIVELDSQYGVIDTEGNVVVEAKYDGIFAPLDGETRYEIMDANRYGMLYFEDEE